MKLSPYEKFLGYLCFSCLFFIIIVGSVGLFITHAEKPTIYTIFITLSVMIVSVIITGILQVRNARSNTEQRRHWYQQMEITLGLSFLCMILTFPTISIFDVLFRAHPLRSIYYLEVATLLFWPLLALFFVGLYLKNKLDKEKKR